MKEEQVCCLSSNISNNESVAISWLRGFGAILIVLCHFFQSLDNELCLLFNVGVQMFFFISGFLFGKKEILNVWSWLVRRAKRVLVPYFILVTFLLIFLITVDPDLIHKGYLNYYLNFQGFDLFLGGGRITGLNHLWFITFIVLCYLMTPLLQWIDKKSPWLYIIVIFGCVGWRYLPYCSLANWTTCYVVGYVLSKRNLIFRPFILWLSILSSLGMALLFNWDYFYPYSHYYVIWHYIIGISICVLTLNMFNAIRGLVKVPSLIKTLDDYSYEIFLVNFIPLVGEFSLIHYGPTLDVNILLIICLIVCLAILLKYISNIITGSLGMFFNPNKC